MKYGVTFMITFLSHLESNNHTVGKFSNGIRVVHFVSLKHETKLITHFELTSLYNTDLRSCLTYNWLNFVMALEPAFQYQSDSFKVETNSTKLLD